jgi:hypothetical protein
MISHSTPVVTKNTCLVVIHHSPFYFYCLLTTDTMSSSFGRVRDGRGGSGFPLTVMPRGSVFSGAPGSLFTNPGGAGSLPGQLYQRRTTDFSQTLPTALAGSGFDTIQEPDDVPPSEPNTMARTQYSRNLTPFVFTIGKGVHAIKIQYPVPTTEELCFLIKPRNEPRERILGMQAEEYGSVFIS